MPLLKWQTSYGTKLTLNLTVNFAIFSAFEESFAYIVITVHVPYIRAVSNSCMYLNLCPKPDF